MCNIELWLLVSVLNLRSLLICVFTTYILLLLVRVDKANYIVKVSDIVTAKRSLDLDLDYHITLPPNNTFRTMNPPRIKYSVNELYRLRKLQKTPLPTQTKLVAKEYGILRTRGCRGGRRITHKISVRVTNRNDRNDDKHDKPREESKAINLSNLMPISLSVTTRHTRQRHNFPRMFMSNMRSLTNKFDDFETLIHDKKLDVCAISETWFTSDNVDYFNMDGFAHFSKYRINQRGGGVSLYISEKMIPSIVSDINVPDDLEIVWCHIRPHRLPRENSNIFLAAVYSPPNDGKEQDLIDHIINTIDELKSKHPTAGFAIMGDFNQLKTDIICTNTSLLQIVKSPTRNTAILDKILTNMKGFYDVPEIISPIGMSDHNAVMWLPSSAGLSRPNSTTTRVVRPMRDSDIRSFGRWIADHDWSEVSVAVTASEKCDAFYASLHLGMNTFFPTKRVRIHDRDKPWITPEIKSMITKRQRLFTIGPTSEWKACRNRVIRSINRAKSRFYNDRIAQLKSDDPASWYRHIKVMTSRRQSSQTIQVPGADHLQNKQVAESINKVFTDVARDIPPLNRSKLPSFLPSPRAPPVVHPWEVYRELKKINTGTSSGPDGVPARLIKTFACELSTPLSIVLNSSFSEGAVPTRWKQAIVVPVPKETPARIDKLRPIALTDHFVKIAELFVTKWLMSDIIPQLDVKQFGSRPGRSTTHCLVDIVNFLAKNTDKVSTTISLITTDFSKAFDRVDHSIVISKLVELCCRPCIIPWIMDFLTDRTQCVRYKGALSEFIPVNAGVPQGTRLGPALFLVLINDALTSSRLEHWKYVDDMTLAEARTRGAVSEVQSTLQALGIWCKSNNMMLNAGKCHVMRIDFGKTQLPPLNVELGSQILEEVNAVKILGIFVQSDLKWNSHVSNMLVKANRRMYMLRQLKPFQLPWKDLLTVYTGYVRPLVEYAVPVWHSGLTVEQCSQIERVQKRALRIVLGCRYETYTNALEITGLTTLESRRQELCFRFARSLQTSVQFRDWLPPPRQDRLSRSLRRVTPYAQIRCRTERFKRSPIPYFVRLLNEM